MKFAITCLLGVAGLAAAAPQGVTAVLTPTGAAPAGCTPVVDGQFEVAIVNLAKRDVAPPMDKRGACGGDSILVATLKDGILTDAKGRTGYIASNYQFQFDLPPQAGALVTAGFSVCGNGSLALGPSTTFYQCQSGDFYNLYDRHWAAQCSPVNINVMACGGTGSVGQVPDGQIIGTTMVATTIVTVLPDGQPQVVPTSVPIPVCQIGDGQAQVHTTPCASLPPPTKTAQPVSQISDGQIQVPPPSSAPAPGPVTPAPPASTTPAPPAGGSATGSASAPKPTGTTSAAVAPSGSATKPAPSSATSAPAQSNVAPNMASSSVVALLVGVVGALFWL